MAILNGTNESETIWGTSGNDTINGKKGNDNLNGLGGDDIFIFNKGDGEDTYNNWTGNNTFQFIDVASTEKFRLSANDGIDLVLHYATQDSIRMKYFLYGSSY